MKNSTIIGTLTIRQFKHVVIQLTTF